MVEKKEIELKYPIEDNQKEKDIILFKKHIKTYENFPQDGVLFYDIFSLTQKPKILQRMLNNMIYHLQQYESIDVICGLDSRGFLFGTHIAANLGIPFTPIRKKGKLPGDCEEYEITKEYGKPEYIEIQKDGCKKGDNIVLVDDLLATGGTLKGAISLVEKIGGNVIECLLAIEIMHLKGRNKIPDTKCHTLCKY